MNDRHSFRCSWDDGTVHRIGGSIDTEEFSKGSGPTVPGFSIDDFDNQRDRIRTNKMGIGSNIGEISITPASMMKKDIESAIDKGYKDLDRGVKIRVLKELMEQFKHEGEDLRQSSRGVKRI